jgi:hypothetical protein
MTEAFKKTFLDALNLADRFAQGKLQLTDQQMKNNTELMLFMEEYSQSDISMSAYLEAVISKAEQLNMSDAEFMINWLAVQGEKWHKV